MRTLESDLRIKISLLLSPKQYVFQIKLHISKRLATKKYSSVILDIGDVVRKC